MTAACRRARHKGKHDVTRTRASEDCEVAVIGAGPYGLAAAAHLKSAGVGARIFGRTMSFWREHMPAGMRLRSPWIATHIADPGQRFSLDAFAQLTALAPQDQLPIERFVQYGDWFQRRAVPDLDTRKVLRVENAETGFRLALDDGEVVGARRVVVAMGLAHQDFRPPQFAASIRSWSATPASMRVSTNGAASTSPWSGAGRARANPRRCCARPGRRSISSAAARCAGSALRRATPSGRAIGAGACASCCKRRPRSGRFPGAG